MGGVTSGGDQIGGGAERKKNENETYAALPFAVSPLLLILPFVSSSFSSLRHSM